MVYVQLGSIQSASWSDNVGVFSGQNIQNAWDSHAPSASSFGSMMGDFNYASCYLSLMYNRSVYGQPTYDADVKGNLSTLVIGS